MKKMKKILSLLFVFTTLTLSSQIYDPVNWEFSQKQISDSEIELQLPYPLLHEALKGICARTRVFKGNSAMLQRSHPTVSHLLFALEIWDW